MPLNTLFIEHEISTYPFFANAAHVSQIRENHHRIAIGMSAEEVQRILGIPDEIRPLYEAKIQQPALIGHTYWYVIQRLSATGSIKDKQELFVRVSFSLQGQVSQIESILTLE